jgi:archaellum component FlaF (FlaF/FlaG flagellin family)
MGRLGLALATLLGSLALAAPASAAIGFNGPNNFPTGAGPAEVVSGDFDRANGSDFATVGTTQVDAFLNNGTGGFGSPAQLSIGGTGHDLTAGDLNGDGLDDLVAGTSAGAFVFLANANRSFTAVPQSGADPTSNILSIGMGDFNRDGVNDIVTVGIAAGQQRASVFLGQGNGHFTAGPTTDFLPALGGNIPLVVADLNGDGIDDVATSNALSNSISVLINNGSGTLSNSGQSPISTGSLPGKLDAGDVNNDGRNDLVVPIQSGGASEGADVFLGTGSGNFATSPTKLPQSSTGTTPFAVVLDDFNNDGNLDIAVGNRQSPSKINLLLGNGSGTAFSLDSSLTSGGNQLSGLASGDFDGDGNVDLVNSNEASNNASVFLEQPPTASVNPTSLNFGNVQVDTTSSTMTVTLTNNGPATIGPVAQVTGSNRGDFRLTNDRCSPQSVFLAPGQSCTIGVNVRSGVEGGKSATLEIDSNAANHPQRVALSATIVPRPPGSVAAPAITGTARVGQVLTCSNGTWTNNPTGFSHQWLRNGQPIPSAASPSYTVQEADVAQQIACRVTATNAGGSGQRTSSPVVPSANTPLLRVTVPKQTLNSVISKGLAFRASCQNACLVSASVTGPVPPKRKKRSSRSGGAARTAVVGRTSASLAGGTTQTLRARISRAGRKALSKKSKATLRLTVIATDPSGSPSTSSTIRVSLKKATRKRSTRKKS